MQVGGDGRRFGPQIDRNVAADIAVAHLAVQARDLHVVAAPGHLAGHVIGRQADPGQLEQVQDRGGIRPFGVNPAIDALESAQLVDAAIEPHPRVLDREVQIDRARPVRPLLDLGVDPIAFDRPRGKAELRRHGAERGALQMKIDVRVQKRGDGALVAASQLERIAADRSRHRDGGLLAAVRDLAVHLGARDLVGVGHVVARQDRAELWRVDRELRLEASERGGEVVDLAVDVGAGALDGEIGRDQRAVVARLDLRGRLERRQIGFGDAHAGEEVGQGLLGIDLDARIERVEVRKGCRLRGDPGFADGRLDLRGLAHGFPVEKLHERAAGRADLERRVLQPAGGMQGEILTAAKAPGDLVERQIDVRALGRVGIGQIRVSDHQALDLGQPDRAAVSVSSPSGQLTLPSCARARWTSGPSITTSGSSTLPRSSGSRRRLAEASRCGRSRHAAAPPIPHWRC